MHRRRTFCIFFVYPFFAYIAPSVAENRVWKGCTAAPKCVEVIVLVCYNWIVVYLEKLWANFPLLKWLFFATSNSISKESRKKAAVVLMVVHDWNFLWAEPSSQIIGISIQLVQHQEKRIKSSFFAWLWTLLKYLNWSNSSGHISDASI